MSNPVPRQEPQPVYLSRCELVCRWLAALLTPCSCRSMISSYKLVRLIVIGYLFFVSVYKSKKWSVIPQIGDSVSEYFYGSCDGSSPSAAVPLRSLVERAGSDREAAARHELDVQTDEAGEVLRLGGPLNIGDLPKCPFARGSSPDVRAAYLKCKYRPPLNMAAKKHHADGSAVPETMIAAAAYDTVTPAPKSIRLLRLDTRNGTGTKKSNGR